MVRGPFHKSWAQSANHRDSFIHLCPTPTPTFGEAFYWHKSWARGRRAQKQFMKSTPDAFDIYLGRVSHRHVRYVFLLSSFRVDVFILLYIKQYWIHIFTWDKQPVISCRFMQDAWSFTEQLISKQFNFELFSIHSSILLTCTQFCNQVEFSKGKQQQNLTYYMV